MAYGYYSTGTVTTTSGSKTVTGSGTDFVAAKIIPGGRIFIEDHPIPMAIASVDSATQLTLENNALASLSGKHFSADKLFYEESISSTLSALLGAFGTALDITALDRILRLRANSGGDAFAVWGADDASPQYGYRIGYTYADRSTFRIQRNTGSTWADVLTMSPGGVIAGIGSTGGVALVYTSRASLYADLAHADASMAWVLGDATTAYDGVYRKSGASGAGSWARVADLPYSFATAVDAGTSTANAMVMTTDVPVSESSLIMATVPATNTSGTVTVQFNGGSTYSLKDGQGSNPVVGAVVANMVLLLKIVGSTVRMVQGPTGPQGATGATGATGPAAYAAAVLYASGIAASATAPITLVTYLGTTYQCSTTHTTTGTFDAAKWTVFAAKGTDGTGTGDLVAANHLGEIAALGGTAQSDARGNLGLGTAATYAATDFAPAGTTGVTDGDKGDIVVSSSGAVWTTEKASQAEAEAGTDTTKVMTAARVKERVAVDIAALRSRLPVIDVTPSFNPAAPVDVTSTIASYLDNYGACVLPPGEWLTTSTIETKSRSLTGLNAASTTLQGNISSVTLPVIRAGRNCRIAEMTLRYIDAQVSSATTTAGHRVLIDTAGASSGDNPMQRPSSIERIVFGRCGTGLSDRGGIFFSVSSRDLEFYDYARAAVDLTGDYNTGCVWSNIYIGSSQFTPITGFSSVGFRSEDYIDSLNIEHALFSDTALRLVRQNNLRIGTLHVEGAGLTTTQKGFVTISNSIVEIGSANFFFTRLPQAASSLFDLVYTGYYDGVSDATVAYNMGYLKIGALIAYGIGQPNATLYPAQSANLTSSFNFFYRMSDSVKYIVDIDRYDFRTYNTDSTTVSRYQTMASDPNSSIHFIKKSALRRSYPTASLPSGGLLMPGQTVFDETAGVLKIVNNAGSWVAV